MKFFKYILLICLFFSCKEKLEEVPYTNNSCAAGAAFISKLGISTTNTAFSTSESRKMGLHLINASLPQNAPGRLLFQDSTWKMAGWLGPMLTDSKGNVWCAPVPVVNILHNPTVDQNNLYRVDPRTGKMELFLQLPYEKDAVNIGNPYGIIGLAFNCETNTLYVSSVMGSSRTTEKGKIYAINIEDKKVQSSITVGDAFGMGISYKDGFRKLYYGSARSSNVYSIGLNEKGNFVGNPELVFSLDGLGPRGDDKVRKIKEDGRGDLKVYGYEFNFNLTAPTEKQENEYIFTYDINNSKWVLKS
jgi:hypothetical protein